jgi:hypothetical protein
MAKYSVYVIELSKRVWNDSEKFRSANPQYNGVSECLYVGMTSLTPDQRFKKHKTGAKSKKGHKISAYYAEKYGLYLRPSLYEEYNPISSKAEAYKMEEWLAKELKKKRYAVWWN